MKYIKLYEEYEWEVEQQEILNIITGYYSSEVLEITFEDYDVGALSKITTIFASAKFNPNGNTDFGRLRQSESYILELIDPIEERLEDFGYDVSVGKVSITPGENGGVNVEVSLDIRMYKEGERVEENWEELIAPGNILTDPKTGFKYKIGDKDQSQVPEGTNMFCVSEYISNKDWPENKWVPLLVTSHPKSSCPGCRNIVSTNDPSMIDMPKL